MKEYRIDYIRMDFEQDPVLMETLQIVEYNRVTGLTSSDFKNIIRNLFFFACEGWDHRHMAAVIMVDGKVEFSVLADSFHHPVEYSTIDCHMTICRKSKTPLMFYRKMNIAS